jgi:hypothetical protein
VGDVSHEVAPDLVDPSQLVGAEVLDVLAPVEHYALYSGDSAPTPARFFGFASKR